MSPVPGPAVQRGGAGVRHPWVLVLLLSVANSKPLDICDNGKSFLEVDLPPPEAYQCPGPHWPLPDKELSSVDKKYPIQRSSHICMGKPIKYNETIPNSGRHRPQWAHYGEYLYCPPQRWVHNLEHGGVAFLYHPCAPPSLRASLSALARSCLFKHIVTPFPGLTRARPLALAAWGRTLEMSHVTLMEAADWLRSSVTRAHESGMREDGLYNLLLIRGSKVVSDETDRDVCPRAEVQAQRQQLFIERLPPWREGREREWTEERGGWVRKRRVRRSVLGRRSARMNETKKDEKTPNHLLLPSPAPPGAEVKRRGTNETVGGTEGVRKPSTGEQIQTQNQPGDERGREEGNETHSHGEDNAAATGEKAGSMQGVEKKRIDAGKMIIKGVKSEEGKAADSKRGEKGEPDEASERTPVCPHSAAPPGHCDCSGRDHSQGGAAVVGSRLRGMQDPTLRTEEAAWAAAALGFLLVVLTLSVLHTRLYRRCQRGPSLYWSSPSFQGYDTVAEVIKKRLKRGGKRKRRVYKPRKREEEEEKRALLRAFSSEESD
ncbi:tumor protein p53-inducible protein 13 [Polyodon spathula]|uniref:tumor protein p53-inducible protein 13 n=1 Tax=Polyodon spathula TaxID=7913 RepID=UPI001B7E2A14|nr:tumor protein p53-inducible protein 13 [Polyodon spathula]